MTIIERTRVHAPAGTQGTLAESHQMMGLITVLAGVFAPGRAALARRVKG